MPSRCRQLQAGCSKSCTQVGGEPQQVRKHAARRHLGTRARSLHDERIVAIAPGRKRTTLSVSAMLANACLESSSTTPTVALPSASAVRHKQHLALGACGLQPVIHAGIVLRSRAMSRRWNLSRAGGHETLDLTSAISSSRPISRPRMMSLRATSIPTGHRADPARYNAAARIRTMSEKDLRPS